MSDEPANDTLQIRCPNCGQRFKVGEDLRDRMVECGACEHRFYLREDVILRSKKFYPGESPRRGLERFHRTPIRHAAEMPHGFAAAYQPPPAPPSVQYEPVGPQRIIAGILGAVVMVLMALLLMFGGERGGMLDGMETARRLVMAVFTAALGLGLLLYANPRSRMKALIFGGMIALALVSLPFFFTEGSRLPALGSTEEGDSVVAPVQEEDEPVADPLAEIRERIGTRPLEAEARRLAEAGSAYKAYGLSLQGLRESNRLAVRDFLYRVTGADPSSHMYPRDSGRYLMVLTGLEMTIEHLAEVTGPLGEVTGIFRELGVVEIKVNNELFIEGSLDRLNDRNDPSYYELNLRELQSIELTRVQRAVQRLAEAEPAVYRADITRRLRELLDEGGVDFQGIIARALRVWDEDQDGAAEVAGRTVVRLHAIGQAVERDLMALPVREKIPDVVPVLSDLWRTSPTVWEELCIQMGAAMEGPMIRNFQETTGSARHSAARILARIGGPDAARTMRGARPGADPELQSIIDHALDSIESR